MQLLALLTLPLLASAAPTLTLTRRAGAPTKQSLPASCPITNAYPSGNSTAFAATSDFAAAHELYAYSLSPGATTPDGTDDAAAVQDCLETCYGFGNPGDCKSVWSAHGVGYEAYGTTVRAEFVCRLFGADIQSSSLGAPAEGDEDSLAKALVVGCERSG